MTSRHHDAANTAAAPLGARAAGFAAHAADEEAAHACVEFAIEQFGSLDILVNNAATNPAYGPVVEQDRSRFMKTLEVNVWAPQMWAQHAWEKWMRDHGGVIVNVASLGGLIVGPGIGTYNTSKAALIHMTRHLARELAPRVRVNAIAPGVVKTRMAEALWKEQEEAVAAHTALGRIAEPADIADVVLFLASDRARWITGETLVVDGGEALCAHT